MSYQEQVTQDTFLQSGGTSNGSSSTTSWASGSGSGTATYNESDTFTPFSSGSSGSGSGGSSSGSGWASAFSSWDNWSKSSYSSYNQVAGKEWSASVSGPAPPRCPPAPRPAMALRRRRTPVSTPRRITRRTTDTTCGTWAPRPPTATAISARALPITARCSRVASWAGSCRFAVFSCRDGGQASVDSSDSPVGSFQPSGDGPQPPADASAPATPAQGPGGSTTVLADPGPGAATASEFVVAAPVAATVGLTSADPTGTQALTPGAVDQVFGTASGFPLPAAVPLVPTGASGTQSRRERPQRHRSRWSRGGCRWHPRR